MTDDADGTQASPWRANLALGLPIGIGVGIAFGASLENMGVGLGIGITLGIVFSVAFGGRRPWQEADADEDGTST